MAERTFTAVLHKEGSLFVAECPEVGTVSQGSTLEEAVTNLKAATELYLEEFPTQATTRVFVTTFRATCVLTQKDIQHKTWELIEEQGLVH